MAEPVAPGWVVRARTPAPQRTLPVGLLYPQRYGEARPVPPRWARGTWAVASRRTRGAESSVPEGTSNSWLLRVRHAVDHGGHDPMTIPRDRRKAGRLLHGFDVSISEVEPCATLRGERSRIRATNTSGADDRQPKPPIDQGPPMVPNRRPRPPKGPRPDRVGIGWLRAGHFRNGGDPPGRPALEPRWPKPRGAVAIPMHNTTGMSGLAVPPCPSEEGVRVVDFPPVPLRGATCTSAARRQPTGTS